MSGDDPRVLVVVIEDREPPFPERVLTAAAGAGLRAASFPTPAAAAEWLNRLPNPDLLRAGAWMIDRRLGKASVAGVPLPLTAHEVDLLFALAVAPGWARYQELERPASAGRGQMSTMRIKRSVMRLRARLVACGAPAEIQTVRGRGFRLILRQPPDGDRRRGI